MIIKIGADELILWLRKNNFAQKITNEGVQGLGLKIHDLIVNKLNGEKVSENAPSYWANMTGDKNVNQLSLPKTSAQYKIDSSRIGELYEIISTW